MIFFKNSVSLPFSNDETAASRVFCIPEWENISLKLSRIAIKTSSHMRDTKVSVSLVITYEEIPKSDRMVLRPANMSTAVKVSFFVQWLSSSDKKVIEVKLMESVSKLASDCH